MTDLLFREDAYLRDAPARVVAHTEEGGIVLDASIFYPTGGGQPGDSGRLDWPGGGLAIATAVKGDGGTVVLVPAEPLPLPRVGTQVMQVLDWERRHRHMRVHTALHLLSVVIPLPVTGGQIGAGSGRLDFAMPQPPEDREALEEALNALVDRDLVVSSDWIEAEVLEAHPELIKTMSVSPPRGEGKVRLVRIGQGGDQVDLQPCGGTHVARTGEIGRIRLGKIENKGKQNRRVNISLD
ncbi:alanyl-tRNA editing protein [Salipiger marinus]|uniref:alanyl-tRNA editing protein n=1 Tax=Salipiger marinus TaxID=555512 RepID=UPI001E3D0275|nr:alanyl-tRNA editing protein [Salipiger manganoxidans]MCD1616632.1 alanyl-tRNA editing protein [Salipiger manganoxidans]MEB3418872.1 alanyl-tRNA editing protein [Salipiger manganoxidans]